jgi:hypothetical protein
MTSAAPEIQSPASSDPIVDEPLTSAPSESTFDELAKLFTSPEPAPAPAAPTAAPAAAPATDESDSLGLIHEGEDVLGRAAEMQNAPEPSALDSVSTGPQRGESGAPESATFAPSFLEALGTPEPPAAPSAPAPATAEPAPPREAAPDASAAFVTETMAELYLKQGHHELALDVYRKLVAARPDDAALRARLEELEKPSAPAAVHEPASAAAADAGPTIREFLASIAGFRPGSPNGNSAAAETRQASPPTADRSAAAPNDSSVGASLHSLFVDAEAEQRRQDVPAPAAPPQPAADLPFLEDSTSSASPQLGGKPSTPAANELSLDHVFRHATPAAGSGSQPSSFSFDQFFSQTAHQDVSTPESESGTESSAGASDDIQQFNAWLEGLKKT